MPLCALLALDIDGTLINSQKILTTNTIEALLALQERGLRLALISGRRNKAMIKIAEQLKINTPLIAYNGGLIFDPKDYHIIEERSIIPEAYEKIVQIWWDAGLTGCFYNSSFTGYEYSFFGNDDFYLERPDIQEMFQKNLVKRLKHPSELDYNPLRLMVGGRRETTEHALELVREEIAKHNLWSMHSRDYDGYWFLEICSGLCDKGDGLKRLCEILNIPLNQTIAVGDQINDINMIRYAGLGIAMQNAVPELKAVADLCIGNHDLDGLAEFAKELLAANLFF